MTFVDASTYIFTLVAILLAPGQMMLLVVARAASGDIRGAIVFSAGTALGVLLIITAVCFGMGAWMADDPAVLGYSKYVMLAYLAWIARGMWNSSINTDGKSAPARSGVFSALLAGFIANMMSPYMMVLFPLVLPEVLDITAIQMPTYLYIVLATLVAEIVGGAILIGLAMQVRRLIRSPRSSMIMNRSLASLLMVGGTAMAVM